nr:14336_t:CDS:2 [Entrophospora candida]
MFTGLAAPKDFREAWEQAKKIESTLKKDNPFNNDNLQHINALVANQVAQLGQTATGWKSLVEPRVQEPQNYNTSYSYMIESLSLSNNSICSPPTMENISLSNKSKTTSAIWKFMYKKYNNQNEVIEIV